LSPARNAESIALEQGDLESINDALHDLWLDINGIERSADSVRVPISRLPSGSARQEDFSRTLVIAPVKKLTIVDPEGIGFYDIDFLELRVGQRVLVLHCNMPIDIHIELEALPVHLQLEDG
jgi:hypothetical protein